LHLGAERSKFLKSFSDALYVTYVTQGFWGMLRCACIYIPNSFIKIWVSRVNLGYQVDGIFGVIKSLLYALGWHSVWNN
jgi:hypothetical protein